MSDKLVTGRFEHGKFRHELPEHLASLLEDTARLLRQGGSQAIHMARILSTATGNPAEDAINPSATKWRLTRGVDLMNQTWRGGLNLHAWLTDMLAHSEGVGSYEDDLRGCISCERDAGHFEPTDPSTRSRYCRWCRGFRETYGHDAPIPIISARHRGARITMTMLEAHGVKLP